MELVFLLEELSAKRFLDEFLPRFLPEDVTFRTIPHHGKSDLQRSLPTKLRAWQNPNARFVVLHDKDHNDCIQLKQSLRKICLKARPDITPLIRIACHEIEAWYLGDFGALQKGFPGFKSASVKNQARYRDVDALANASEELSKLIPEYQKVSGSRAIGRIMDVESNSSKSFRIFVLGVKQLLAQQAQLEPPTA
jgi:hypothetical protein